MAKKLKEQIDYGNTPERMDPNLERKLGDPESLYAQNPAMKKGAEDVQRLVSQRFQKVANKLRQVTGIENLNSKQVQGMVYQEMMSKLPRIMSIEARHKDELIQLAIDASLEEGEVPENTYQIEGFLGESIDASNFRYQPDEEDDEEEEDDEDEKMEIPSFDVEDLTDEEELELEKHKRNIINAIIQGAAKKGHYLFQKPNVKARLDDIDPSLYPSYLGIMAINDFMYFTMEQMIEMMSQTGQGVAGKMSLEDADDEGDEGGGEGDDDAPDTKIVAEGMIFPILCHEIIKGLEAVKGRYGQSQNPSIRQKVKGAVDLLSNEPMQLRIGPEIVEKIRLALPDEMFSESNKGLINWFHISLYQLAAQEFLQLMGDVISADESKVKRATSRFREIMKEAMQLKEEYDEYVASRDEEEMGDFLGSLGSDEPDDDDDDDFLDDFLNSMNISRPK
jgi:NACalpha-BTF3-like transcription factor